MQKIEKIIDEMTEEISITCKTGKATLREIRAEVTKEVEKVWNKNREQLIKEVVRLRFSTLQK